MPLSIRILSGAQDDLDEAVHYYRERSQRVAAAFIDSYGQATQSIARSPSMPRLWHKKYRRWAIKRFPFGVIYRVTPTEILIVAIAHDRRKPRYWSSRN